eukprot:scaffold22404_cov112-Isochrysis_galbana.AAC.1
MPAAALHRAVMRRERRRDFVFEIVGLCLGWPGQPWHRGALPARRPHIHSALVCRMRRSRPTRSRCSTASGGFWKSATRHKV